MCDICKWYLIKFIVSGKTAYASKSQTLFKELFQWLMDYGFYLYDNYNTPDLEIYCAESDALKKISSMQVYGQ